ncbi:MAG: hypothetical protein OMM_14184 [Candidatus Magnetoglobus multicellularis str. Araruama]|uniref:Uncharacterized protein n=1 Tax=Candidatus Magnetoglobus multicellularis str. Araruama TaxID=890399 RepID=A0A1V1NSC7_9BACT|nr:MAG: hypothetical protein OMM_14184 [Candidatus Magnetoglobus multicellularis str. Araruama]
MKNNWTEIDVSNEASIKDWFFVYTWITDIYPEEASFHVLSPQEPNIQSLQQRRAVHGGTYTVSPGSFNYELAHDNIS